MWAKDISHTAPTAVQKWMVMGMARGLGDGLLRLCHGAWRDNDGDAVDIVEVVRCKDCKKRDTNLCPLYHCVSPMINSMDDDFCSYGKK